MNAQFALTIENKLDLSQNQVYAATMGYAWDALRDALATPIDVPAHHPELTALHTSKGFQNTLKPHEFEKRVTIDGFQLKATAKLAVKLPFRPAFKRNQTMLEFNGERVHSFGCTGKQRALGQQVSVLFYKNENCFAVQLHPQNGEHAISLYCNPDEQASTFIDAFASMQNQTHLSFVLRGSDEWWRVAFTPLDELAIPVLSFGVKHSFEALLGNAFNANANTFVITQAEQTIDMELTEEGGEIKSTGIIASITGGGNTAEPEPKRLIFDKPFWLFFHRKMSFRPYAAFWVANSNLMEPIPTA